MKIKKSITTVVFVWIVIFCKLSASGQTVYSTNKDAASLLANFKGIWEGSGKFSNGTPIAAEVSFLLQKDSCWIREEYSDRLPNRYLSTSLWGVDKITGTLVVYVFDNFQGHRKFTADHWSKDSVVLRGPQISSGGQTYFERFTYLLIDHDHFRVTYAYSREGNIWKARDGVNFERKKTSNSIKTSSSKS